MNKPNHLHRPALVTAASRRGRFHQALILGLMVASSGCAVTRKNTLLARSEPAKATKFEHLPGKTQVECGHIGTTTARLQP